MSRITKAIAENVAKQLVAQKETELSDTKNDRTKFITDIYIKTIPEAVMKVFKSHPDFLHTTSRINFEAPGIDKYQGYNLLKYLPFASKKTTVTSEQANKIIDFDNAIADKKKEISELKTGIEVALFNLRTYNNVEKEFPEAFKLLPVSQANTGLMVNIKSIRCKLDPSTCN